MRILAIETATEACSVALFEDGQLLDARHEVLGRGHAERLVPMIAELPGKGRAGAIRVSLGPGSFTGVRIGLATARALGIAWGAEVLGYPTLALIAAQAGRAATVCMNGGHGEFFVQNFDDEGAALDEVRSLAPAAAADAVGTDYVVGNRAQALASDLSNANEAHDTLPDARHLPQLNPRYFTHALAPIYGRGPDAKLPGS